MEAVSKPKVVIEKIDAVKSMDFRVQEAFNTLRTNIQFCGSDIKVIALTSCVPNEGKSSVSFRLALSFADAGKKVLYIDADIRRSVFVGKYRIQQELAGLTHYLSGQSKLDQIVYTTNVPRMDMIFTGPVVPNPSELLGSQLFARTIQALKQQYDYVVVDTPPLGSVIDSALIAQSCDGAVMVIAAGGINYKMAQSVKGQLEKSGCRLLGAVLNKVDLNKKGYYYNSYYGKYDTDYQTQNTK